MQVYNLFFAGVQSDPLLPGSCHLHPIPRSTQFCSKPTHILPLLCQYWSVSTFFPHKSDFILASGKCLQRVWCRRHCPCCSTPEDDLLGSAGLRTTSTGSTLLSRFFKIQIFNLFTFTTAVTRAALCPDQQGLFTIMQQCDKSVLSHRSVPRRLQRTGATSF